MKRIILFGAPGAGKGTQAANMEHFYGYTRISTGDLIRSEIETGTLLGQEFQNLISKGLLVSDDIIIQMVKNFLENTVIRQGYIVDGFPRTINQADFLSKMPADHEIAIYLKVGDPEVVVHRVLSRLTCVQCGEIYTASKTPPERQIDCSKCGGSARPRTDDTEDIIRKRIMVYREKTKPVIKYYRLKGLLHELDAAQSVDDVFTAIKGILN